MENPVLSDIAAANMLVYAGHVNKVIADHSLGKPNALVR